MSQAPNFSVPRVAPAPPDEMAGRMADSLEALNSSQSGSARPANATTGTIWLDTGATPPRLCQYNGTVDLPIGVLQAASSHGDTNWTMTAADANAVIGAAITAARTWTLPSAASFKAGQRIVIDDAAHHAVYGGLISLAPHAGDTIEDAAISVQIFRGAHVELISDGAGNWRALFGGTSNMALLAHYSFSGSTNIEIDFSGYLDAGYNHFVVETTNLRRSGTDAALAAELSTDGGSTMVGSGTYHAIIESILAGGTITAGSLTNDYLPVAGGVMTTIEGQAMSIVVNFDSNRRVSFRSMVVQTITGINESLARASGYNTQSGINAMVLYVSGATLSGEMRLYGVG